MGFLEVTLIALLQTSAAPAASDTKLPALLPEAEEIELALSAAPEAVATGASAYVLRRGAYERVRDGKNGFACLVERAQPGTLLPTCYDAEGVETILPRILFGAKLREEGKSDDEVRREIADGYRTGRFRAPRRLGLSYMLSPKALFFNRDSGRLEPWPPHVMVYAPYLRNADVGTQEPKSFRDIPRLPFVVSEGQPNAYMIFVVPPESGPSTTRR